MNHRFLHFFILFALIVSVGLALLFIALSASLILAPELLLTILRWSGAGLCWAFLIGIIVSALLRTP